MTSNPRALRTVPARRLRHDRGRPRPVPLVRVLLGPVLLGPVLLSLVLLAGPAGAVGAVGAVRPVGAAPTPGFGWPLAGAPVVERRFEPPATVYGPGHRGADLRGVLGQPVLAAGAGRVSFAGRLAGRGGVTVTHADGLRTTYEPLQVLVAVGDRVARGDVLGQLASGHASCRAGTVCLHWGLLRGTVYLDPLALVRLGPVRLLPVGSAPPAPSDPPRARAPGSRAAARGATAAVAGSALVGSALLVRRRGR